MKSAGKLAIAALSVSLAAWAFAAPEVVVKDLAYKPGVKECIIDLVHPAATGFPTVVWFHGGGLTAGSRHFINIDRKKIAIAAVEYRMMQVKDNKLVPNGPISPTDVLDDCAAAVAWVRQHIAEYGGDPNKIVISGHSAGGYISYMLGLDPKWLKPYGLRPRDFAGYAPISGQATKHFAVRNYYGQGQNQLKPIFDEWAPIYHATADVPPFCLMIGDKKCEWPMRVQETEYLYEILKALGNKNVLYYSFPDAGHGFCNVPAMCYLQRFVERLFDPKNKK